MSRKLWIMALVVAGCVGLTAMAIGANAPGNQQTPGNQAAGEHWRFAARVMHLAITADWALADAQTQQLVDKVLADRGAGLQDRASHLAAVENLVAAERGKDANAIAAAQAAVKAAGEKDRQDAQITRGDFRALVERLRAIKPAGVTLKPEQR